MLRSAKQDEIDGLIFWFGLISKMLSAVTAAANGLTDEA